MLWHLDKVKNKVLAIFMSRQHIVVISGAGISAESGLSTFPGADEDLWDKYDVSQLTSVKAFNANPELVLRFHNERRRMVQSAHPNAAHSALADLEKYFDVTVITQNVDDLHERAGSKKVVHLHGEILKAQSSIDSSIIIDTQGKDIKVGDLCELGSQLRPNVVWFGEDEPMMETATKITATADVLLVIGTSLAVYPAASLVTGAPPSIPVVVVSLEIENELENAVLIREKSVVAIPRLVNHWLEQREFTLTGI